MSANMNLTVATPLPSLTEREAKFAEHFAIFDDPAAAWMASGNVAPTTKRLSVQRAAYGYLSKPHVRNRITELRNRIAEVGPAQSKALLVRQLEESAGVDVREIVRLKVHHCPACYSSDAYARWWPNAMAAFALQGEPLPPDPMAPDVFDPDLKPWPRCAACAGAGRRVTHHADFDELSPAAKRLLRGVELHADGTVKKVLIADLTQLGFELNKTVPGFYAPSTSVSVNLNADLKPLKRGMSVDEALAIMESIAPTQPAALPAVDAEFTEVSTES